MVVAPTLLAADDPAAQQPLSTPAFVFVVALIAVVWVMARVHAERRMQAHGKGPQTRLGFVRALAAWGPTHLVLGTVALALAAAAWFLR